MVYSADGPKNKLNHSRITLIFVIKLNIGTETFHSPFCSVLKREKIRLLALKTSKLLNASNPIGRGPDKLQPDSVKMH